MNEYRQATFELVKNVIGWLIGSILMGIFLYYFLGSVTLGVLLGVVLLLLGYSEIKKIWATRHEITEEGIYSCYEKGVEIYRNDLNEFKAVAYKSYTRDGSLMQLDLIMYPKNEGVPVEIDCEPLGEKVFFEMYRKIKEFTPEVENSLN